MLFEPPTEQLPSALLVTAEHMLTLSPHTAVKGLSIDETGKQHYLDASVAYKRAVLNCIDYLSKFGYTKQQVRDLLETLSHPVPQASAPHRFSSSCSAVTNTAARLRVS